MGQEVVMGTSAWKSACREWTESRAQLGVCGRDRTFPGSKRDFHSVSGVPAMDLLLLAGRCMQRSQALQEAHWSLPRSVRHRSCWRQEDAIPFAVDCESWRFPTLRVTLQCEEPSNFTKQKDPLLKCCFPNGEAFWWFPMKCLMVRSNHNHISAVIVAQGVINRTQNLQFSGDVSFVVLQEGLYWKRNNKFARNSSIARIHHHHQCLGTTGYTPISSCAVRTAACKKQWTWGS